MLRALVVSLLASSLAACGPSAGPADAGTDVTFTRRDAARGADSITFHVTRGPRLTSAVDCAGCAVSIVAPGPRRLETVTDEGGRVTLSGFSWGESGRISATFFAPEHSAFSISGYARADYEGALIDGVFEVFLPWRTGPVDETLVLTGVATGASGDPMSALYVQSTDGRFSAARGSTYTMRVGIGATFDLLATDFVSIRGVDRSLVQTIAAWAFDTDVGPFTADATHDIDLSADALTPMTSSGSFVLPDAPFFTDSESLPNVAGTALGGSMIVGLATNLTVDADGRTVDFTLERVALPGVTDAATIVSVAGPLGASSSVLDVAAPTGVIDPRLLTPPAIETSASRPLFAPVTFLAPDPTLQPRVRIETTMGTLVWTILGPVGAASVAMPAPPFETDDALLGGSGAPLSLFGQVCELRGPTAHLERCRRSASTPEIVVAAP